MITPFPMKNFSVTPPGGSRTYEKNGQTILVTYYWGGRILYDRPLKDVLIEANYFAKQAVLDIANEAIGEDSEYPEWWYHQIEFILRMTIAEPTIDNALAQTRLGKKPVFTFFGFRARNWHEWMHGVITRAIRLNDAKIDAWHEKWKSFDFREVDSRLRMELAAATQLLRDTRHVSNATNDLEAEERKLKQGSGNASRSPVTLSPPQIMIEGNPIALAYDVAVWIKAVIDADDWLSSAAFNTAHPEFGTFRPDKKEIPEIVKTHLVRSPGKGFRWKT